MVQSAQSRVSPMNAAASLHRHREQVLDRRRRTSVQRAQQPSVADFYKGRNVLVTGGSGFLGRMLIEQLLRTCPDIGEIYLVVRAKKGEAPQTRLQGLLDVPLFDRLRAQQPGALSKLVVIPGDITELGLGLSREHQDLVRRKVSVVFHVAASVRFDDPFQKAVFTNVRSTREVVELARGMQLAALVHVSTAYTNTNRDPVGEVVYPTHHDWRSVIRMAEEMDAASLWAVDCLGPKLRGFQPNMYTFTKALAEVLIDDVAGELPVVIVRPSIVLPSFKDPVPGWIDNLYGMGALWAAGYKGVLRVMYGEKENWFDSVPADLVTKNTILASWARGLNYSVKYSEGDSDFRAKRPSRETAEVVNATLPGSVGVGLSYGDMKIALHVLKDRFAYPGSIRDPKFSFVTCYPWYQLQHWYHHVLYGVILDTAARLTGQKPRAIKIYRNMITGIASIGPFMTEFRFALENQIQLQSLIHPKDEEAYCILDFCKVRDDGKNFMDWCHINARGVMVYALREEESPDNMARNERLKLAMKLYHGVLATIAGASVYAVMSVAS